MASRFLKRVSPAMLALTYGLWIVASAQAADAPVAPRTPQYRTLAPGVEFTILPDRQDQDTHDQHDIVEILQSDPKLPWIPKTAPPTRTLAEMSRLTEFRHKVWYLEFTFKPVRMIWVDVPQESGRAQRKLVWYMVYHVKNVGGHLQPKLDENGKYSSERYMQDVRFFPQFVIEAPQYKKEYLDRLIPVAVKAIQEREDPNRKLLNSVEISTQPIPTSTERVDRSVWGVATWEGLDPRIDYFSVFVRGLTNATRWTVKEGAYKKGDPPGKGRVLTHKTLELNFWRPGDEYVEDKRIVRFGAPGKVDYQWVYR